VSLIFILSNIQFYIILFRMIWNYNQDITIPLLWI
jgi:hypothetical protein